MRNCENLKSHILFCEFSSENHQFYIESNGSQHPLNTLKPNRPYKQLTAHLIWAIFDNCLWKIYRLKLKLPRKSVKLMNQIKHNWPRTLLEWSENDCRYYALICLLNFFCCKHRSLKKHYQNQQINTRFSLKFIKRSNGEI